LLWKTLLPHLVLFWIPEGSSLPAEASFVFFFLFLWKAELTNYSNISQTDVFMSELAVTTSGNSDG